MNTATMDHLSNFVEWLSDQLSSQKWARRCEPIAGCSKELDDAATRRSVAEAILSQASGIRADQILMQ